jgi:hypothetical protein
MNQEGYQRGTGNDLIMVLSQTVCGDTEKKKHENLNQDSQPLVWDLTLQSFKYKENMSTNYSTTMLNSNLIQSQFTYNGYLQLSTYQSIQNLKTKPNLTSPITYMSDVGFTNEVVTYPPHFT